jgi:Mrp family chromosome partitioning ATPase
LSDPSLKPSDLIQNIHENLDAIPSGPKPPDPAKLLNSQRCQDVINDIRALPGYDIVLFDAPPCLMLADPILLGEKLDGILFLVGLGKVNRDLAPQAARRIKATGVDVLGLICNQVNFPSRLNDYGYEYGYYYHYAYAGSYAENSGPRYGTYGTYDKAIDGSARGPRAGETTTAATLSTPVDTSPTEKSSVPGASSRSRGSNAGESRLGGWLRRFAGDKKS